MKILVTGGCGFIGSVTVRNLKNLGHDVVVYDNLSKGHRSALPEDINFIEGELSDKEKIKEVLKEFGIESVIHFAAYIEAGESMHKPAKYFENNVINTLILLEAMLEVGVKKIVFSSSAAVYGTPKEVPIDEDAELKPESPYGETKLLMEYLLKEFVDNYGFKAVALRYFNAAGASHDCGEDHHPETHIIPRFINAGLKGEDITIFGDGSHRRDYVHIEDLAKAHILAVKWLEEEEGRRVGGFFEYFNLGTGKMYTNLEITKKILELITKKTNRESGSKIVHLDTRPGDPQDLLASNNRAKEHLGWIQEKADIEDIISDALNWHLASPTGFKELRKLVVERSDLEIVEKIVFELKKSDKISKNFKINLLEWLLKNEIHTMRLMDCKKKSDDEMLRLVKDFFSEKNKILEVLIWELKVYKS